MNKLHTIFYILTLPLIIVSCSKDFDSMSLNEKSIHQENRYNADKSEDKTRKPLEILNFSDIQPGMKVLDLLGGGGYYTELFDYIVGSEGKVFIQNNSLFLRFSGETLTKRLKNSRLKNTVRIDSEFSDMKLPENMDLVFIGLSYHDIYVTREDPVIQANREEFLSQLTSSLKPGGILLIVDHAAKPGTGISMTSNLHRIDEEWTKKDLQSAGFEFIKSLDVLRNPNDDYSLDIWKDDVIYKTDRFIHMYKLK